MMSLITLVLLDEGVIGFGCGVGSAHTNRAT